MPTTTNITVIVNNIAGAAGRSSAKAAIKLTKAANAAFASHSKELFPRPYSKIRGRLSIITQTCQL